MDREEQAELVPLFPLGIVVFPGDVVPLHIFEERYKLLLERCLQSTPSTRFGMCLAHEGRIWQIGCLVSVLDVVNKYEDGKSDIIVVGTERFVVEGFIHRKPYAEARISLLPDADEQVEASLIERVTALSLKARELTEPGEVPEAPDAGFAPSYRIAAQLRLSVDQKQELLELRSERARLRFLEEYLRGLIPRLITESQIRTRIASNGHFPKAS